MTEEMLHAAKLYQSYNAHVQQNFEEVFGKDICQLYLTQVFPNVIDRETFFSKRPANITWLVHLLPHKRQIISPSYIPVSFLGVELGLNHLVQCFAKFIYTWEY